MKYSILFLLFIFCNFSKDSKPIEQLNEIKIEIVNSEIISRTTLSRESEINFIRFKNFIYDSIPVNKINLRIINKSNKTYVLFIEKELKEEGSSLFKIYKDSLEIQSKENIKAIEYTMNDFFVRKEMFKDKIISLNFELHNVYQKQKLTKESIEFQIEKYYLIIHPNETKHFSFFKSLPLFKETSLSYFNYDLENNRKYYFQLCLKNDADLIKKNLTADQLNDIEENGYILFDGELKSNKVPIKFVKI